MASIQASYRVIPPAGTPAVTIATENQHIVNVDIDSTNTTTQDGVNPINTDDSTYYSALLASLATAKTKLNADLTIWKEAVGDREKQKEAVPIGHKGKQGLGKAMMMVQAAKENDALPDDDDDEEDDEDEADEEIDDE